MNLTKSTNAIFISITLLTLTLSALVVILVNDPPKIPRESKILNVDSIRGQVLFRTDCNICHPDKGRLHNILEGVVDRLGEKYIKVYLTKQDSRVEAKDHYAIARKEAYKMANSNNFNYTDQQLNNLISHLK